MKIKDGFMLREVGSTKVIIAIGKAARDFRAIAHVNSTGAVIFKGLKDGDSVETISNRLASSFDVDASRAQLDVLSFAQKLAEAGIAQE